MIYDYLEKMPLYFSCNGDMKRAYAFLRGLAGGYRLGRHELGDDGMYANVEMYVTQPEEGRQAEAHRRYIDVQFVLRGRERIGYAPLSTMNEAGSFDTRSDIGFYEGICKCWLPLYAGDFAVIYPHEAHLPGTAIGESCEVVKAVVKIPVRGER
jgi:YhcH/YjgK/YiaL family protein